MPVFFFELCDNRPGLQNELCRTFCADFDASDLKIVMSSTITGAKLRYLFSGTNNWSGQNGGDYFR